jgi:hypothetical protein
VEAIRPSAEMPNVVLVIGSRVRTFYLSSQVQAENSGWVDSFKTLKFYITNKAWKSVFHQFSQANGGSIIKPFFATAPAAPKNEACFRSGQNQ